jgi:succinoglycan biosynthesis protein ExoU
VVERNVAVVIAAKDAAATAARAVASALAQSRAAEVVFVDDGSSDATAEAARACDDRSGRLKVLRLEANRGPAHARNLAIAASRAPFFCVLDADDFFGDERLGKMFAAADAAGAPAWDLLADDIRFCRDMTEESAFGRLLPDDFGTPRALGLAEFVDGNLPRPGRHRRELGFLKPIVRRAAAERIGVRYDERLRLGEDVLYYARLLVGGAVFRVVQACGYHAVQHPGSLSARHRTGDVAALYQALVELRDEAPAAAAALAGYIRTTRHNLALRDALDRKRDCGWTGFLDALRERPDCVAHILKTVARDKLAAARG